MESATRLVVLVLGLIVLAFGVVGAFSGGWSDSRVVEEIEASFSLPAGHELVVRGRNGTITYEPWSGSEVVIVATKEVRGLFQGLARGLADWVKVDIAQDARGVRAVEESRYGLRFFTNVSVRYLVRVPEAWEGVISLTTSNGRVTARGLRGDATIRTSNGPITVDGSSGILRARTSNGALRLTRADGVVQAESSNGAITLENGKLARTGWLRTSNGPIDLRAELEKGAEYSVRTSNGRVALTLVDPDVALELSTSNGSIGLEEDVVVSELGRNRVVGRIGDGAARLDVRTSNGSIRLRSVN